MPLERLDAELAEADSDDAIKRQLVWLRAVFIDQMARVYQRRLSPFDAFVETAAAYPGRALLKPWLDHRLNRDLGIFSALDQTGDAPWPKKMDDIVSVGAWPAALSSRGDVRAQLDALVTSAAQQLATLRCERLVLAVERYRRDHQEALPDSVDALALAYIAIPPIDPFSGRPLRMVKASDGFSVYSVNTNRRDDGGQFGTFGPPNSVAGQRFALDLGIRVSNR